MDKATLLDRETWVRAAARALSSAGVAAVRVEALARELGVTKGSFYWHFRDRNELLSELLAVFQGAATEAVIVRVETKGGTPEARLKRLLAICTRAETDRFESAVRAWGMDDPRVREVLTAVDARREGYVTDLLVSAGIRRPQARDRARALYLALIGEFTWVSHGGSPSPRSVWKNLIAMSLEAQVSRTSSIAP